MNTYNPKAQTENPQQIKQIIQHANATQPKRKIKASPTVSGNTKMLQENMQFGSSMNQVFSNSHGGYNDVKMRANSHGQAPQQTNTIQNQNQLVN